MKRKKKDEIKPVQRKDSSGWIVDYGMVDGKRVRKTYRSEEDALRDIPKRIKEYQKFGDSSAGLTDIDRFTFMKAKAELGLIGFTIDEAVEFVRRHAGREALRCPLPLLALVKKCVEEKQRLGKSDRHLATMRSRLGQMVLHVARVHADDDFSFDKNPLSKQVNDKEIPEWVKAPYAMDVTPEHLEEWLYDPSLDVTGQNLRIAYARLFFKWAVKKRYLISSPMAGFEMISDVDDEYGVLSIAQLTLLLKGCLEDTDLIPYVVGGLFCGGRRSELLRSDMGAIRDDSLIIAGAHAKRRSRRAIDLPDVAKAWLKLCDLDRVGTLKVVNFPARYKAIRSGIDPWPHNGLRNSFISYHYAKHKNEDALKALSGHSLTSQQIHDHYRDVVTTKEAEQFWKLTPSVVRKAKLPKS